MQKTSPSIITIAPVNSEIYLFFPKKNSEIRKNTKKFGFFFSKIGPGSDNLLKVKLPTNERLFFRSNFRVNIEMINLGFYWLLSDEILDLQIQKQICQKSLTKNL